MKGETIRQKLSNIVDSQAELARLLGVTPQAVSEILASSDLRTGTIEKISQALNLPIAFFLEEETNNELVIKKNANFKGKLDKIPYKAKIGEKVKTLLKTQNKKFVNLCKYVGKTDSGMRKMFDRDTCNISVIAKMAEYFDVPMSYFLPEDSKTSVDLNKDKEIQYLKGKVAAYEKAIEFLLSDERMTKFVHARLENAISAQY